MKEDVGVLIRESSHVLNAMILITLLAALTTVTQAVATDAETDVSVEVRLTLSVGEFDPAKPAGVLRVEVANESSEDITIPTGYRRQKLVVYGRGASHRWPSALWRRRQPGDANPPDTVLEPGQSSVVFEISLTELFSDPERRDKQWGWDWIARPKSPASPIHRYRDEGYEDVATFWAEVRIGGESYASEKVTLKVRQAVR
jgi:hypothetical protein